MLLCGFIYSQNTNHSLELEQANEEYFELNNPFLKVYGTGLGIIIGFQLCVGLK